MQKEPKEYMPRKIVEHHPPDVTEEDYRRGVAEVRRILRLAHTETLARQAEQKN